MIGCLLQTSYQGSSPKPGYVPWEWNLQPFSAEDDAPTKSHSSGYFDNESYYTVIIPPYFYFKHTLHQDAHLGHFFYFQSPAGNQLICKANLSYMQIFTVKVVDVPNLHVFQGLTVYGIWFYMGGKGRHNSHYVAPLKLQQHLITSISYSNAA